MESEIIDIKKGKAFYAVAAWLDSGKVIYFDTDGYAYPTPQEINGERLGRCIAIVKNDGKYKPFLVEVSTETTITRKYHRTLEI